MEVYFCGPKQTSVKAYIILCSLVLALFYLFRHKISDGFPTDSSESEEVAAIIAYMKETRQKNSTGLAILLWFSVAYIAREMLPVSGVFSMHLIAGALFGTMCGYILCVCLTTLSALLAYKGTQVLLPYFIQLNSDHLYEYDRPPENVSAWLSCQVNGINRFHIIGGVHLDMKVPRKPETAIELLLQTVSLLFLRLLNMQFKLIPLWLFNFLLIASQLPLSSFLLSAFLFATARCQEVTLLDKFTKQPGFIRQHQHQGVPASLAISIVLAATALCGQLKIGEYYLFSDSKGIFVAQTTDGDRCTQVEQIHQN